MLFGWKSRESGISFFNSLRTATFTGMIAPLKFRIAPTPSGFLHQGNAYNFVLTYLLAKKMKACLLLRIDDLDRARYREAYLVNIFKTLLALKIEWQEGPQTIHDFDTQWSQQFRQPMYQEAFKKLQQLNVVYPCSCSRKSRVQKGINCCLQQQVAIGSESSFRLKGLHTPLIYNKIDQTKVFEVLPDNMQNFVVQRKNGFSAYQLSSLVDDDFFGVTHVVRGFDLKDSTLAQHALNHYLQLDVFNKTQFLHHQLITHQGVKLSKSNKASSVLTHLQKPEGLAAFYMDFSKWLGLKQLCISLKEVEECVTLQELTRFQST